MTEALDTVVFTPLRRIPTPGGPVLHGIKATDPGFAGFGEAYFSCIDGGAVKGWKRHNRMTLNFVVPHGSVHIVVMAAQDGLRRRYTLSADNDEQYGRLTIPPGLWVAFGGLAKDRSVLLNLANLGHDPDEADNLPIDRFAWDWPSNLV